LLYSSLQSIIPLLTNIYRSGGDCLFIATKYIYSKSLGQTPYKSLIKKLLSKDSGILGNPSFTSIQYFSRKNIVSNKKILIFFYLKGNNKLLVESKQKAIPTVGLVNLSQNSVLIDYPIMVNSKYFYNVYFFSKFFFRCTTLLI